MVEKFAGLPPATPGHNYKWETPFQGAGGPRLKKHPLGFPRHGGPGPLEFGGGGWYWVSSHAP